MKVHHFESTGDAYDATQCDDTIRNGDILVIKSEGVVGIADTWPFAVTETSGKLHSLADGVTIETYQDGKFARSAALAAKAIQKMKERSAK
jgi:hypothetical protein